ncbi:hypothetical protein Hdeb2414_s0010g00339611 [Helianthus debilis subsp. tardiflorus]
MLPHNTQSRITLIRRFGKVPHSGLLWVTHPLGCAFDESNFHLRFLEREVITLFGFGFESVSVVYCLFGTCFNP